jgi:hypothetical protein
MIPTQVHEPLHRDGWIYAETVDGWRARSPMVAQR